jgi:fructose-specific phosphotransferase system IIC component
MTNDNHESEIRDRRAQRLFPGCLAVFMSAFVAGIVTAVNTGIDAAYPARWLVAWGLALPAAVVAAYLFRPLAWRLVRALVAWRLWGRAAWRVRGVRSARMAGPLRGTRPSCPST